MIDRDTIMGQVLTEVEDTESNSPYLEKLDNLYEQIENKDYMDNKDLVWNKNGLTITDEELTTAERELQNISWIFVETPHKYEYSWLVKKLEEIYNPKHDQVKRLFTTIGYLMNVYSDDLDSLDTIFKLVAQVSSIWLHPDHLGMDKFRVYPANLPDFGSEY